MQGRHLIQNYTNSTQNYSDGRWMDAGNMLIQSIDPWKLIKLGLINGSNFKTNLKDAREENVP